MKPFAVQFLLFIVLLIVYWLNGVILVPNVAISTFPLLIIIVAGLGLGIAISAVTTKYRDLNFIITFGVPLLMYTTMVICPLLMAIKNYSGYSRVIKYNSITPIIETFGTVFWKGRFYIGNAKL